MGSLLTSPPRPRLAVGIGVTGHRSLPEASPRLLRQRISAHLAVVADVARRIAKDPSSGYDCSQIPLLRVVSALAAGSDQIVADEAIIGPDGFALQSVLPFDRETYLRDFAGDRESIRFFEGLLERSEAIIELNGPCATDADRARSYEAAGKTILAHCDILIAVWDGEPSRGRGGTAEVVHAAIQKRIPVIWIRAKAPHDAHLILNAGGEIRQVSQETLDNELGRVLQDLLCLRTSPGAGAGRDSRKQESVSNGAPRGSLSRPKESPERQNAGVMFEDFLAEQDPRLRSGRTPWLNMVVSLYRSIWTIFFKSVTASKKRGVRDGRGKGSASGPVLSGEADKTHERAAPEVVKDAAHPRGERSSSPPAAYHERYDRLFSLIDRLAIHYASMYRSSFLINYFLGASAVTTALLAYALRAESFVVLELAIIVLMAANFMVTRGSRWHDRAADYRLLAEQFRQMTFLGSLGQITPYSRPLPFHPSDPSHTWMKWYFRAVVREQGLPRACLDERLIGACLRHLHAEIVKGQREFHEASHGRYEALEKRLHGFAIAMFLLTGFSCLVHLVVANVPAVQRSLPGKWLHEHPEWLTVFAAALPAWGAAAHAISSQAEAKRLSQRYKGMAQAMEAFDETFIRATRTAVPPLGSLDVIGHCEAIARIMLEEVIDWQVIYKVPETVLA